MCLLVVCEPNSTPKSDDLHAGACSNPHGFGFAIDTGSEIISERGMSAKKIIKRFLELREQYPNGYAMWHARYATHGVKNEANCHPFKVGGSDDTYLAHNGVLDVAIHKSDKRSDTRVFAEDILPMIGGVSALDNDTIYGMVSVWAGSSKIAVLTRDPSAQHPLYLINEDLGEWDNEGVWWSNKSHKRSTTYYTAPVESTIITPTKYDIIKYEDIADELTPAELSEMEFCPTCEGLFDYYDNPYTCPYCEACLDCGVSVLDCLCYIPNQYKSKQRLDDFYYDSAL